MKSFFIEFCRATIEGLISFVIILLFCWFLREMLLSNMILFQIVAVILALAYVIFIIAGLVFLIRYIRDRMKKES